jgi:hypothetical protein
MNAAHVKTENKLLGCCMAQHETLYNDIAILSSLLKSIKKF